MTSRLQAPQEIAVRPAALDQKPDILRSHDPPRTELVDDPGEDVGTVVQTSNTHHLAISPTGIAHRAQGVEEFGRVPIPKSANLLGEIVRSDQENIGARQCCDVADIGQGIGRFDHDEDSRAVGVHLRCDGRDGQRGVGKLREAGADGTVAGRGVFGNANRALRVVYKRWANVSVGKVWRTCKVILDQFLRAKKRRVLAYRQYEYAAQSIPSHQHRGLAA